MGCECSKENIIRPTTEEEPIIGGEVLISSRPPTSVRQSSARIEKITFQEFTYAINVIKKNDTFLVHQLIRQKKSNENLGIYGSRSTYLHYAAKFNSYKAMNLFLIWIKEHIPDHFYSVINTQDMNGRTPAMVCAVYGSAETLYVLLQTGEINEDIKDVEGKNLQDLCNNYSRTCSVINQKIKDFGKDFSMQSAIQTIQRVKKVTTVMKDVMRIMVFRSKFSRLTMRPRQSSPTEAYTPGDVTMKRDVSVSNKSLLKQNAQRNFEVPVLWCKFKRYPAYDSKFQRNLTNVTNVEQSSINYSTYQPRANKKHALTEASLAKRANTQHVEDINITEFDEDNFSVDPHPRPEDYSDESSYGEDSEDYNDSDDEIDMEKTVSSEIQRQKDEDVGKKMGVSQYKKLKMLVEETFPNPQTTSLLQQFVAEDKHFTDQDFPPHNEILGTEWLQRNGHLDIMWKRPHEFLSANYSDVFLFDRIDPHDIEQGQLGVCYLLAAVSAVAEFPSRIQKIFINQESNPQGVYGVKFYVQGMPTEIVLDDHFPCTKSSKQKINPVFSKPKGNELWVLLLEKAWAKVFGTYSKIETGVSDEAFEYLLGVPSSLYLANYQSADQIWRKIYNADKRNYIISASTLTDTDGQVGLAASHTYSVISAHKVAGFRILKLRNPWGRFEWNGDFSDYSPLWTPEIKQAVGYVKKEDGMFCMTVEDFKVHFAGYVVAKYHDDWSYSYIEGSFEDDEHAQYFKFTIDFPTVVYLRFHQKNERFRETKGYAAVDFRVARVENDEEYRVLVAKSKYIDDCAIFGHHTIPPTRRHKLELKKAGTYIVRAKMQKGNLSHKSFTISAYAPEKIFLEKLEPERDFLTKIFLNLGRRAKHREDVDNGCFIARGFSGFNHYLYAENNGNKVWTLSMSFPKISNAKLGKPYRVKEDAFKMVLAPGERKATYLTIIDLQDASTYANPVFNHRWDKVV